MRSSKFVFSMLMCIPFFAAAQQTRTLTDTTRQGIIPIALYEPSQVAPCRASRDCPVAFINPGYEGTASAYSFLAKALSEQGYLVVGVQHDLVDDAPLPTTGDLLVSRAPFWRRGAESLVFLKRELAQQFPAFKWDHVTLIGHSNGGDIAAWFAKHEPEQVSALITLDHRRFPLPRLAYLPTLTIRSSDQKADEGVLPNPEERLISKTCIVPLSDAPHNDMHDGGKPGLKAAISKTVIGFIKNARCATL